MTHTDARSYRLPGLLLTVRRVALSRWAVGPTPGGLFVQAGRWHVLLVRARRYRAGLDA